MARLALWPDALADFEQGLVDTLPGEPLTALERDLCRRALSKFIRFDLAIEGLVDEPAPGRRFGDILARSDNGDARRLFAGELSRYGWARLRQREVKRGMRALALAQRVGGTGSLFPT